MEPLAVKFSRRQLAQRVSLSDADLVEINRCRRGYTRLGFAYQLGFVKLHGRFPRQDPLELQPELLTFISVRLDEDGQALDQYQQRRMTVSEHQERIRAYLCLRRLEARELEDLEAFVFEIACRLEHSADLQNRAREFLREQQILLPADSRLARIVAEHRE